MRPALPLALALAALMVSCGGAPSYAPPGEARTPDPAAVIGWALGGDRRAPRPPTGDAYLLLATVGQPPRAGTRAIRGCVETASFLPAPSPDPRIFFVVKGGLHVRPALGKALEPLQGSDPALTISRLLAWKAATSPLEVLVEAKPQGAKAAEIWIVEVEGRTLLRQERARAEEAFTDQESFFEAYTSPRCLSGGSNCLVLTDDEQASYLEIEPIRGKAPQTLADLGPLAVRDVAWASKDGQSVYFLVDCLK